MNWPRPHAAQPESAADESYRLISVDSVSAPEACTGSNWHKYRIVQGENGITGYRRGDLAAITADLEAIVTALNDRREWQRLTAPQKSQRRAAAAARRARASAAPDEP
jgi:hypothetical protein